MNSRIRKRQENNRMHYRDRSIKFPNSQDIAKKEEETRKRKQFPPCSYNCFFSYLFI